MKLMFTQMAIRTIQFISTTVIWYLRPWQCLDRCLANLKDSWSQMILCKIQTRAMLNKFPIMLSSINSSNPNKTTKWLRLTMKSSVLKTLRAKLISIKHTPEPPSRVKETFIHRKCQLWESQTYPWILIWLEIYITNYK
jgi:hypothetical protein